MDLLSLAQDSLNFKMQRDPTSSQRELLTATEVDGRGAPRAPGAGNMKREMLVQDYLASRMWAPAHKLGVAPLLHVCPSSSILVATGPAATELGAAQICLRLWGFRAVMSVQQEKLDLELRLAKMLLAACRRLAGRITDICVGILPTRVYFQYCGKCTAGVFSGFV